MKKWLFISLIYLIFVSMLGCDPSQTTDTTSTTEVVYTVKFFINTSEISSYSVNAGDYIMAPFVDMRGYELSGWYTSTNSGVTFLNQWHFDQSVNRDLNLYARWIPNKYTITFESNGGTPVDPIYQDYKSEVIAPEPPTREGYTFDGWYINEEFTAEQYVFSTMPYENITLYAKWIPNQ
jgi:uncharacterized repeat protein (TIGR02543 family)